MEIDHVIAVGLFIMLFGFSVMVVSNHLADTRESISTDVLKQEANTIFESTMHDDTNLSLKSDIYKFYVRIHNPNAYEMQSELSSVDLSAIGNFDKNSIIVYDKNNQQQQFYVSGNVLVFLAEKIPAQSSEWFTVYVDDDSNFTGRTFSISGTDNLSQEYYGPEKIAVLQHRKIASLTAYAHTGYLYNFHINIYQNNEKILGYGPEPPEKKSIVVIRKPLLVQLGDASIQDSTIEIKVW